VRTNQAAHPIATLCRVLEVSKSGYYSWHSRPPSKRQLEDSALCQRIEKIHPQSRGTYGSPCLQQEQKATGNAHGRKRVARLMRLTGLVGVSRRKSGKTTHRDPSARPAPDLVKRNFSANGPDQLWVADIRYVATWAGFLYLAVVLDVWSRKVVGWSMRTSPKVEIVLEALEQALAQRKRCREAGVRPSMGRVGIATIMRCAKVSSPLWNANCWIERDCEL
jgi:putative transposase